MCLSLNITFLQSFAGLPCRMWSNNLTKVSGKTRSPGQWVQCAAGNISIRDLLPPPRYTAAPHCLIWAERDFAVLRRASFGRKPTSLCQSLEYLFEISALLSGRFKIGAVIPEGLENLCLSYFSLGFLEIHLVGADHQRNLWLCAMIWHSGSDELGFSSQNFLSQCAHLFERAPII